MNTMKEALRRCYVGLLLRPSALHRDEMIRLNSPWLRNVSALSVASTLLPASARGEIGCLIAAISLRRWMTTKAKKTREYTIPEILIAAAGSYPPSIPALGRDQGSGDRRVHGPDGRSRHPVLRPQQAAGGHDAFPAGEDRAVRARRDLPLRDRFDLRLNGLSWMDFIARTATTSIWWTFAATASPRARREMDKPRGERADRAHRDRGQGRRHGGGLHPQAPRRLSDQPAGLVVGHDAHGLVHHAEQRQGERLVLYAPQWVRSTPSLQPVRKLGAYRSVSRDPAQGRWLTGVPEDKKADLIPAGWFEAWADATFATDPVGAKRRPRCCARPTAWCRTGASSGARARPLDPPDYASRRFLAHAEWDGDMPSYMSQRYFAADELAVQALRRDRRRHAYHHHGAQPVAAVPGGPAVPG